LAENNTYTGDTTILANATAEARHAQAFGGTENGTTVTTGGAIHLSHATGISYANEALAINGLGVGGSHGALRNVGGNNTWNGNISLGSNSRIDSDPSGGPGSLTINGTISGGSNVLFLGTNDSNTTIHGVISGEGGLQNSIVTSIYKDGGSTLTLAGTNTYTGATTVSAGTLVVNGSLANTAVGVQSGATLGGSGTISGLVTLNGGATLAPGNSIGTINLTAGLTLNSTSTVRMDISSTDGTADRIHVSGGQLTYAGALVFDAASMAGVTNNTYTLFDTTGATTSGTWDSVALASGDNPGFSFHSGLWTRNAGDGNIWTYDESLGTLTVIPEPSTYALIGLAAALLLSRLRRRKKLIA
jgi:autotransporter-associated beta strand protein